MLENRDIRLTKTHTAMTKEEYNEKRKNLKEQISECEKILYYKRASGKTQRMVNKLVEELFQQPIGTEIFIKEEFLNTNEEQNMILAHMLEYRLNTEYPNVKYKITRKKGGRYFAVRLSKTLKETTEEKLRVLQEEYQSLKKEESECSAEKSDNSDVIQKMTKAFNECKEITEEDVWARLRSLNNNGRNIYAHFDMIVKNMDFDPSKYSEKKTNWDTPLSEFSENMSKVCPFKAILGIFLEGKILDDGRCVFDYDDCFKEVWAFVEKQRETGCIVVKC